MSSIPLPLPLPLPIPTYGNQGQRSVTEDSDAFGGRIQRQPSGTAIGDRDQGQKPATDISVGPVVHGYLRVVLWESRIAAGKPEVKGKTSRLGGDP